MDSQDQRLRALNERLQRVSGRFDQNVVRARSLLDTISSTQESLEQENEQLRALLASIEHIIAQNSDYDAVTEWRDQYHAFLARKE